MHIYLYIEAKTLVYYLQTTKRRRNKPQTIIVYTLFKCNDYDNDNDTDN